jgi:hypothetical protein
MRCYVRFHPIQNLWEKDILFQKFPRDIEIKKTKNLISKRFELETYIAMR